MRRFKPDFYLSGLSLNKKKSHKPFVFTSVLDDDSSKLKFACYYLNIWEQVRYIFIFTKKIYIHI